VPAFTGARSSSCRRKPKICLMTVQRRRTIRSTRRFFFRSARTLGVKSEQRASKELGHLNRAGPSRYGSRRSRHQRRHRVGLQARVRLCDGRSQRHSARILCFTMITAGCSNSLASASRHLDRPDCYSSALSLQLLGMAIPRSDHPYRRSCCEDSRRSGENLQPRRMRSVEGNTQLRFPATTHPAKPPACSQSRVIRSVVCECSPASLQRVSDSVCRIRLQLFCQRRLIRSHSTRHIAKFFAAERNIDGPISIFSINSARHAILRGRSQSYRLTHHVIG